jgi:hypothetical protein
VVTPLSVVDLPESYKDALAGVTGTFRKFSANFIALGSFREGFPPTTLNGGTTNFLEIVHKSIQRVYLL